ncbi:hypothetical protein Aduo_015371 [Ancylostoma duodenale]
MLSRGARRSPAEDGRGTGQGATGNLEKRLGQYLDICTYNCRSATSDADLRTLLHLSKRLRYDVICLQRRRREPRMQEE